ncbi:MAG TPA: APC family permease [Elusimicrobiales bacterium]|nr:APC family permease [Elusimicrobiales bacterium]
MRVRSVVVLTTAVLTFIPFWQAAAVVLCDFGSSAFYAGGIAYQAFGPAFPWYVLAVMLFAGAMLCIYLESSLMFVRGGVYRVVKEGMGDTMAKISVSSLMFDYALTGPISGVSAGCYLAGLLNSVSAYFSFGVSVPPAGFSVMFALLVTWFFWRQNIRGVDESSETSAKIVGFNTVVAIALLVWAGITLSGRHWQWPSMELHFNDESLGWAKQIDWLKPIGFIGIIMAFGHSVLALSGLETLAQVYREMEAPKMQNLKKTALSIFVYALIFTGVLTFISAVLIPENTLVEYKDNLLAGLAMSLAGPEWARLLMQAAVVLAGTVILAGAVNTSMVGANGVLNRVAEDGILADWFRVLHPRYGTTRRIINLIALVQAAIIILCRGDVYLLGEAYAFGVLWSFVLMTLSVGILRFKETEDREWLFPFNVKWKQYHLPAGMTVIFATLLVVAVMNLVTKKISTISGIAFTAVFFLIFHISEKLNARKAAQIEADGHEEKINTRHAYHLPDALQGLEKPNRILVAVRNPNNLIHLRQVLEKVNDDDTDVLVIHSKVAKGYRLAGESGELGKEESLLFTKIILEAEQHGKTIVPLFVLSNDPFYAIAQFALASKAGQVVMGISGTADPVAQLERLVMAWGAIKGANEVEQPVLARVIWEDKELTFELA